MTESRKKPHPWPEAITDEVQAKKLVKLSAFGNAMLVGLLMLRAVVKVVEHQDNFVVLITLAILFGVPALISYFALSRVAAGLLGALCGVSALLSASTPPPLLSYVWAGLFFLLMCLNIGAFRATVALRKLNNGQSLTETGTKLYLWRGAITDEVQATKTIQWSGVTTVIIALAGLYSGFSAMIAHRSDFSALIPVSIVFGLTGLIMFYTRSRTTAAILLGMYSLMAILMLTFVPATRANVGAAIFFFILALLNLRAFRATVALRKLKAGQPLSVASVFD